jgi:hypothetical protein
MIIVVNIFSSAIRDPRKLFFNMLILSIIDWSITFSQKQYSTFSAIEDFTIGASCQKLVTGDFNGDGQYDIATYRSKYLTVLYADKDSVGWKSSTYRFDKEILGAVAGDVDNDGISDLTILSANPLSLKVYLGEQNDTLIFKWKSILESESYNIRVNDINSDGKKDILLFGKEITGVIAYLGKGDGTFKSPQILLQDNSFSDIFVEDINKDGLSDVLAINWVSNQVLLYTSYARLKYNFPSTMDFQDEPTTLFTTQINNDGIPDIAVSSREGHRISTLLGDGLGNFNLYQDINLSDEIDKMIIADVEHGGTDEILTYNKSKKYLSLWIKDNKGYFTETAQYSLGKNPGDVDLLLHSNNNYYDLLFTDLIEKKLNFVYNSKMPLPFKNEFRYITGVKPTSIKAIDILQTGSMDLVIANEGSKSISLFKNNGYGYFEGQVSIGTQIEYPKSVNVIVKKPGLFFGLTTHSQSNQLSVTEVTLADYSHSSFNITMPGRSEILDMNFNKAENLLRFCISTREMNEKYYHIFLYERISRTKFTEKEITQSISPKILGCTATDINHDGQTDFLYLKDNSKYSINLCAVYSYLQNEKPSSRCYYSIKDTNSISYQMIGKDINAEGLTDIMTYLPGKNELMFAVNQGDTNYSQIVPRISNIKINNTDDIQFIDLDKDDKVDMIVANTLTKTLQAYIAKGGGKFFAPRRLMGIEGVSSFVAADFDKDGLTDFALTYEVEGYVRIIYGRK